MRKILLVIDMQKDFIDGALGTKEAEGIVARVCDTMRAYAPEDIYATKDTHGEDYLETQEGRLLPVKHCIRGTAGWEFDPAVVPYILPEHVFEKGAFGSPEMANAMKQLYEEEGGEVEFLLIGLCTDICVVSNALLLKAAIPEARISVDPAGCAGVTPESHAAALQTMQACQVEVMYENSRSA